MKTGFKTMKIATDIPHSKRMWLIRHLVTQGVTYDGLIEMGATDSEIIETARTMLDEVKE